MTDPTPAEALKAEAKPWGFYFWRSNGDGTSSPDFVKGEIPTYKRDVRNVVPLYARPTPDAGEVRTYREGVADAARLVEAKAGPGALVGDDLTRFMLGLAAAIRKLP